MRFIFFLAITGVSMPPRCQDWYLKYNTLFDCIEDGKQDEQSNPSSSPTTEVPMVTDIQTESPIVKSSTTPTILTSVFQPKDVSSTSTTVELNPMTLPVPTTITQLLTNPTEISTSAGNQPTPWWLRPWSIVVMM